MNNGGGVKHPPPRHPALPTLNRSSESFDFDRLLLKSSFIHVLTLKFKIGQELGGQGHIVAPRSGQKWRFLKKNFFFLYHAAKILFLKIEGWKMNT